MQYGAKFGIYVSNAAGSSVGEYWTAAITSANGGWNYYEIAFTSAATAAFGHMGAIFYNHGTSTFTGTADFDEITASEAVDFSLMDKARLWIKAPAIPSSYISSATYKIVDKDNDSYTWTANVGAGGWGYDSGNFADATISGSVDLTQIVKFELTLNAIAAIPI